MVSGVCSAIDPAPTPGPVQGLPCDHRYISVSDPSEVDDHMAGLEKDFSEIKKEYKSLKCRSIDLASIRNNPDKFRHFTGCLTTQCSLPCSNTSNPKPRGCKLGAAYLPLDICMPLVLSDGH